ncbi:MAG: histidine kinase dimerization/phospho-acceptor domain-containing protein, partial [Sphingomonadales bacterium]
MASAAPRTDVSLPETALGVVFNSLPNPVLVVTKDGDILHANLSAEDFFAMSLAQLARHGLADLIGYDSPLMTAIAQVGLTGSGISEYEVEIGNARSNTRPADFQVTPMIDDPSRIVVSIHERSIAHKIDRQLTHRGAARSVMGMAAVLAHEIKNPLSGIRGSAQLLEQGASENDREFTRLICDETDRICALVDRMELFSDRRPVDRKPVNLHQVLEHVRRLAS